MSGSFSARSFMKQKTLSAGAVPVKIIHNKPEFLILRSFKYWDFPKGMVEEDEDAWDAAIREVKEETGLTSFATPWGKAYFETKPYGKGKVARYYLIRTDQEAVILLPNPVTGIVEHHEHRWLPYEAARQLLVPRVQEVLDWAMKLIET